MSRTSIKEIKKILGLKNADIAEIKGVLPRSYENSPVAKKKFDEAFEKIWELAEIHFGKKAIKYDELLEFIKKQNEKE